MSDENEVLKRIAQDEPVKQVPLIERWEKESDEIGFDKPTEDQSERIKIKMQELGFDPDKKPEVEQISSEQAKKILGFK